MVAAETETVPREDFRNSKPPIKINVKRGDELELPQNNIYNIS